MKNAAWYASISKNARRKVVSDHPAAGPFRVVPSSFDPDEPGLSGEDWEAAGALCFRVGELADYLGVGGRVTWPATKVVTNIGAGKGIFVPKHVEDAILALYDNVTGIRRPELDANGNVVVRYS